ncbi:MULTISPECIES: hypothetical protein [Eggerthella]|uniref:hypothetical protein n=1 Tax=Eggerthella TaxID=84111 RepID=UPI0035A60B94
MRFSACHIFQNYPQGTCHAHGATWNVRCSLSFHTPRPWGWIISYGNIFHYALNHVVRQYANQSAIHDAILYIVPDKASHVRPLKLQNITDSTFPPLPALCGNRRLAIVAFPWISTITSRTKRDFVAFRKPNPSSLLAE